MKAWINRIALGLAIAFLVMTFVNASWLAGAPGGGPRMLAARGIGQLVDYGSVEQDCDSRRIEPPVHEYLENTLPAIQRADALGAMMIEIDVQATADGRFAMFRDKTLDCRTNGKGAVSQATMEQLKGLDAGYGYSADSGKTFPLRGRGQGYISPVEALFPMLPRLPLLYNVTALDPAQLGKFADMLSAQHRDVEKIGDGFLTSDAALPALRQRFPKAWAFSMESAAACTSAYKLQGWLGLTPASCQQGTMLIPIDGQMLFAGWPNRLLKRMSAVGGRVVLIGPASDGVLPRGLDVPNQLPSVPSTFNGLIWLDDIWVIGPALHPSANHRNAREEEETAALVAKRMKAH